MQINLTDSCDNIHSTSSNSRQHTLTLGTVACGIQCAQEHHNRGVSRISARGVPHTKSGGGGGGGGGGPIRFRSDIMGGDHSQNSHPLFNYQGGGGGSVKCGGGVVKWGGGGVLCNVTDCGKASPSSIPYQSQSHAIPLETNPFPLWAYKQMAS